MKILVLGGTRFVGRAIVEDALAKGHEVTIVHRGHTGDNLFGTRVETIHADRLQSLEVLTESQWDACIDTCAYFPRAVRMAADALADRVRKYVFISTISVYKDPTPGATENAPVHDEGDPQNEIVDAESYGFLKVLCEREVVRQFGEHSLIVRPGIVVGPHDHTDRFTYWVYRIGAKRRVLVPAERDLHAQWVDVRDLASFVVDGAVGTTSGSYHTVGESVLFHDLLRAIRDELNPESYFIEADLETHGIEPWTDMPLVTSPDDGAFRLDPSKALAAGFTPRPVSETVRDLFNWFLTQGREPIAGMPTDRHLELIEGIMGPGPTD
jgi:2'-hydroxyisoflavone reductase